jgi:hypothetical protein
MCDGLLLMVFSPLLFGRMIAADAIPAHAIEAWLSKARSGIAGIFASFWAGTRNARKFRDPPLDLTRRACKDRIRPGCDYAVLEKRGQENPDSNIQRNAQTRPRGPIGSSAGRQN